MVLGILAFFNSLAQHWYCPRHGRRSGNRKLQRGSKNRNEKSTFIVLICPEKVGRVSDTHIAAWPPLLLTCLKLITRLKEGVVFRGLRPIADDNGVGDGCLVFLARRR
jgi:hypothetical protein